MTYTQNKRLLSTIIAIASVMLVANAMSDSVFADHPLTTGNTQTNGDVDVCYLTSEFDNMLVGGAYIQSSSVVSEVDDAIDDWNSSVTDFDFDFVSGTSCGREVGSKNLSGTTIGLTTYTASSGTITDVDFDFDNSGRNWQTGNTCSDSDSPNIEYVATHELGHWIQLDDATTGTEAHTVMFGSYHCNALDVQTADSDEVDDDIY